VGYGTSLPCGPPAPLRTARRGQGLAVNGILRPNAMSIGACRLNSRIQPIRAVQRESEHRPLRVAV